MSGWEKPHQRKITKQEGAGIQHPGILAFVQVYLRAHEFDVDTFLTVKGLLDAAAPDDNGSWDRNDMILELPPLSPAERMVDALFGPNQVDRRGF